jgi:murein DD-endopeptidase MepM/ murein hydrolase activator NlpD
MPLLKAAINSDPNPIKTNNDLTIVDDTSLMSEVGPSGSIATSSQILVFDNNQITTYVVRSGDTLPQIAQAYGISVNTIMIANDLTSQKITEGQRLIILPVSGIQHTVKSGETLQSIATKYKVTVNDIREYNNLEGSIILAGDFVFVPTDKLPVVTPKPATGISLPSGRKITPGAIEPLLAAPLIGGSGGNTLVSTTGFFIQPLSSYVKTQGLHGHNGVDLAASTGTSVKAAADGEVVISRIGWNGGYGTYIVIQHSNGTQTLYAHMSKLLVSEGQTVSQGQTIGLVGSTGASTGAHLHFEVRGGVNPF